MAEKSNRGTAAMMAVNCPFITPKTVSEEL
jgi:hypothetical protein